MSILDLLPTWRAWLTFALVVLAPLVLALGVLHADDGATTIAIHCDDGTITNQTEIS